MFSVYLTSLGDFVGMFCLGLGHTPGGGSGPRLTPVFDPRARVPRRVEGRGPVGTSKRYSRAVPDPPEGGKKTLSLTTLCRVCGLSLPPTPVVCVRLGAYFRGL